jgi:Domain of unknown function (DUF4918)
MMSNQILQFYQSLKLNAKLPKGVGFMNPYQDQKTFEITTLFYRKYYHDTESRKMILGINPGRFGGGITGVPFTDPINLEKFCGIENDFQKKPELSSTFIYQMIEAFGGSKKFYTEFYISALSPLGFVKEDKNLNYYDIPKLQTAVEPFIISCIQKQLSFNINREVAFCLGEGENFKYLLKLNQQHQFFSQIIPLPHPRFILQYKRKLLDEYVGRYLSALK